MAQRPKPSRRHHHVWQHCLEPWTTDGAAWCRQYGRAPYRAGTRALAVENDFHRLHDLTPADVFWVRLMFSKSPPGAQRNNELLLQVFRRPFEMLEALPRVADPVMRKLTAAYAERFIADALEDYHTGVEGQAAPLLDLARKGDLSFCDDERSIAFLYFLSMQLLRTKGAQKRAVELGGIGGMPDLSRVWNILVPMFATTMGGSHYLSRRVAPLTLIRNDSDVAFVTGDQPVINLLAEPHRNKMVERSSLYYPIAPNLALIIPEDGETPLFPATGLTRQQAQDLNERLTQACHRQVFGAARSSLEELPDCVG